MTASFYSTSFLLICATILMMIISGSSYTVNHHNLEWIIPTTSSCKGSIAECLAAGEEDDEFDLDSEVSRRILATSQYISYGALKRNTVPCSRRGASYYNCKPGAQANPYSRGCSAITRCRS